MISLSSEKLAMFLDSYTDFCEHSSDERQKIFDDIIKLINDDYDDFVNYEDRVWLVLGRCK